MGIFTKRNKSSTKWIRIPKAGQFRGEGTWTRLDETQMAPEEWERIKQSGYLPTFQGKHPPKD